MLYILFHIQSGDDFKAETCFSKLFNIIFNQSCIILYLLLLYLLHYNTTGIPYLKIKQQEMSSELNLPIIIYMTSYLYYNVIYRVPMLLANDISCIASATQISKINFDVLLTVHISIFISVINQLYAQNFGFTINLFHASTCFEHMCSKHVEA